MYLYLPLLRCSNEAGRRCGQGEGPCYSDSECRSQGSYLLCLEDCVDRAHYPLARYPHLAEIYGYQSGHPPQSFWSNTHLKFGHLSVMIFTEKRPKLPSQNIVFREISSTPLVSM